MDNKKAKQLAFELWQQNPKITGAELNRKLKEKGIEVNKSTAYSWLKGFSQDKGELSLEQIIKAAGSVEALSLLFYQGVMQELTKKDEAYHLLKQESDKKISRLQREMENITDDRDRVMREYNEKLAKVKVGTVTLDETKHRLIPKS